MQPEFRRTSDALPLLRAVEIKLGTLTTTIDDPDLAAALGKLTPEQLQVALRGAFVPGSPRRAWGPVN